MDQHLTLSEAREFTGKSQSTLKRLLHEITSHPQHPDRPFILPAPEEVQRRREANEPYAWKIDRQLLLRRFPSESESPSNGRGATEGPAAGGSPDLVIQVLQQQLQSKDEQIRMLATQLDRKDEQLAAQNERMRESNVLMRELQQRLALAPPQPDKTIEADVSEPPVSKKTNPRKSKPKPAPTPKPTRKHRGFLGLFRAAK